MVELSKKKQEKQRFMAEFIAKTEKYENAIIFNIDNVGSHQLQQIRILLRGKGEVVCGKNTIFKKAITGNQSKNPKLVSLIPLLKNNVCMVFTNGSIVEVRDICTGLTVPAAAKVGQISDVEVIIPGGSTGMEPTKTSFFQALGIPTRITRGAVDIISPWPLLKIGDKVNSSHAVLLQMMDIKPFTFGMKPRAVYENGTVYAASVLDLSDADLANKLRAGIRNVAAVGLATGIPNAASVPHSIVSAFKNLLSIAAVTDITFKQADNIKAYLADPSKFASAVAAPTQSSSVAAVVEEEEEEASSSDAGLGGLF